MDYIDEYPKSQDDALAIARRLFPRVSSFALTLLAAGTGIGKSRIMRNAADSWLSYRKRAVIFLVAPSALIADQLKEGEFGDGSFTIINVKDYKTYEKLEAAVLTARKKVLVCAENLGHRDNEFKADTYRTLMLMKHLHRMGVRPLVLIDELHAVLTSLVGGINACVNHAKDDMESYGKIRAQKDMSTSLNVFDMFRSVNAHVVVCSATLNNVICSKLSTLGYPPSDMQVWNLFPVMSLYERLEISAVNVHDFATIAPYLEKAELEDGKILLIFSTIEATGTKKYSIADFRKDYERHFERPMPPSVEITCKTFEKGPPKHLDTDLAAAKYVMGVNLLGTGFDIGTHCKGSAFSLGILFRNFSDKASQPLSSNPFHKLHVEMSAALAQVLGRMRKGGLFLVPPAFAGISLHDLQLSISCTIHDGHTQYQQLYIPLETQLDRYHHATLVALVQNLRYPELGQSADRPTVEEVLCDLANLTERDFKMECQTPTFCVPFWTQAIGTLWEIYYKQHLATMGDAAMDRFLIAAKIVSARTMGWQRTGRGFTDGRVVDERITAEVKARAGGRCCHCGRSDLPEEFWQICHFMRYASGGLYLLDNLGYGHRSCDAAFDGAELIHDAEIGGYWLHPNSVTRRPDAHQLSFISPDNIKHRWLEHRDTLCPGAEAEAEAGGFRTWLIANEWIHFA